MIVSISRPVFFGLAPAHNRPVFFRLILLKILLGLGIHMIQQHSEKQYHTIILKTLTRSQLQKNQSLIEQEQERSPDYISPPPIQF